MANINENKKYHFIYKTTNLLNGNFYIGMHSTINLNDGYLGSGTRLRRSIRKYGIQNFKCEIIEFLSDRKSLINREIELVNDDLLKEVKCLNLMCGGHGGFISKENQIYRSKCGGIAFKEKLSSDEEFRNKFSKEKSELMYKTNLSGKIKHDSFKGKIHSIETKDKMSENASHKTGEKNSQFGTIWINNGIENKKIKKDLFSEYPQWVLGRILIGNIGKNQYTKQ